MLEQYINDLTEIDTVIIFPPKQVANLAIGIVFAVVVSFFFIHTIKKKVNV